MVSPYSFDESQFNRLFPFYLLINRKLEVIAMGVSVSKLYNIKKKEQLAKVFSIPRPFTSIDSLDSLIALNNQMVILESSFSSKPKLRGQFEYLSNSDALLFVGSPWFDSMEEVLQNKLVIDDFARHDPMIDLLHVLKAQEITNADLRELLSTINKQKETLKHTSEEFKRLAKVASANNNGVIFTSPDGFITWANEGFLKLTGYSKNEVIGKTPIQLCRGNLTDENTLKLILDSFYKGEEFNNEIIFYKKDKNFFVGRVMTQPLRNEKGELIEFFGIIVDITKKKDSEQKFKKLIEKIGDNVWEHDFVTGKTTFSTSVIEFLGYKEFETNNHQELWWNSVFEEDLPLLQENDRKYRMGEIDSHSLEYRIKSKDGTIKWVLDRGVVFDKDDNGLPLKITGTHTEITERKTQEQILEKQRKFYESILNNVPAEIAVFSPDHEYLFVNPKGIKDKELRKWIIGKKDEDYCLFRNKPMSIAQNRRETFNKVVDTKAPAEWEEKIINASTGEEEYVLRRWYPVLDNQNKLSLVIGYGLDITERKKIEQAVKANEEKYRSIIANMNLGLMEMGPDRKIIFANQTLLNMTGVAETEIVGYDSSLFLSPKSLEEVKMRMGNRSNGLSEAYEIEINIKNNKSWWLVSSAPRFDSKGKFAGSIVICLDINRRKELEEELINSRQQAEFLAKTKEAFLANMSHEIRTPMNAIIGMGNQLAKTYLTDQQQVYLNTIKSASENLLVIINDILDLSKIEAGKLEVEKIGFSLSKIFEEATRTLRHKAEEKGLSLDYTYNPQELSPVLIGDPFRLNQVLLNLISNAIKFTEKGSINISCEVIENTSKMQLIQISVADTGIGMDKEFINKIFDKFSQEYQSMTRKYGGTGLGMNISKQLTELMSGTIDVLSEEGKGTTIIITLPFNKGSMNDLPVNTSLEITGDFLKNKKIFIVDDNEMNRLVAKTILENYAATTIELADGKEAVEKCNNEMPDLILMDIQMPELNGYDATKMLRDLRINIPIIALTANAIKGESEKCFSAGMNDYISKPFKEDEFIRKIAKWLNTDIEKYSIRKEHLSDEPLYSLQSLREISRGNDMFVEKMVKLFCMQANELIQQMQESFSENDIIAVSAIAHKMKPSIDNLHINLLKPIIRNIEAAKHQASDTSQVGNLINKLQTSLLYITKKMEEDLSHSQIE